MRSVPAYFQKSVQSLDHNLRVRWHPGVHQYAVERKMDATEADDRRKLQDLFWRRANRGIKNRGPAIVKAQLERRHDAQSRLDALNDGYRLLFYVPEVDGAHLRMVQYTLKKSDLWSQGDYEYRGDVNKFADHLYSKIDYDEAREDDRIENRRRSQNRELGSEAYTHLQRRTGQRISV